jgi:hypothetical protein
MKLILSSLCILAFAGCATKPPTKLEQSIFTITTNYIPRVEVVTNIVPVTVLQTNTVTVTNIQGVTQFFTNVVPVIVYQTNVASSMAQQEVYSMKPGPGAQQIKDTASQVGSIFGLGDLVGTGIGALLGLWGLLRSHKSTITAANIAQSVETIREFIKTLPNGTVIDNEFVNWMTTHQAEAGVLQNVINLISSRVSNADAQSAARIMQETIRGLQEGTKTANA